MLLYSRYLYICLHFFIRSADWLAAVATCSALEASVESMLSLKESIAVFT